MLSSIPVRLRYIRTREYCTDAMSARRTFRASPIIVGTRSWYMGLEKPPTIATGKGGTKRGVSWTKTRPSFAYQTCLHFSSSRCDKNLASKDGLRRHMESVHETIDKNFACPICGNRFLRKEYLAKHLKTHEFNYEVLPADTTTVSASPTVS